MENLTENWYSEQIKTDDEVKEKYRQALDYLQTMPAGTNFKIGNHFRWNIKAGKLRVWHDKNMVASFNLSMFYSENSKEFLITALAEIS